MVFAYRRAREQNFVCARVLFCILVARGTDICTGKNNFHKFVAQKLCADRNRAKNERISAE